MPVVRVCEELCSSFFLSFCPLGLIQYLSYRSCTIHRNACVYVSVCLLCNCVIVYQCREKKTSRSATPIFWWGRIYAGACSRLRILSSPKLGSFCSPFDVQCWFRWRNRLGEGVAAVASHKRDTANDQAYTDDEQKHWFDKNDYRWLRERGVCTRPALGIYIETNPISHYVLDLSLPVNSQFMLVISRCIYILLNPRKKRPVTQKLVIIRTINDRPAWTRAGTRSCDPPSALVSFFLVANSKACAQF